MIDIALGISLSSLLLLWIVSLATKKISVLSKFPISLLLLLSYRTGINITIYFYIILHRGSDFNQASFILSVLGDFLPSGNLITDTLAIISLFGLTHILLSKLFIITETAARKSLDAFPEKDMTIDRDLKSQLICVDEVKTRRIKLQNLLDTIGAFDGISKFFKVEYFINIILISIVLLLVFLNIIDKNIGLIIRISLLGYLIPIVIQSMLTIHSLHKLENIFTSQ